MDLADLLTALREQNLWVHIDNGQPWIRGGQLNNELRQVLAVNRDHILRLVRSDAQHDGSPWRQELRRADVATREAWALLAAGNERSGLIPEAAEWLAWEEATGA